jgi:hypothetical protein
MEIEPALAAEYAELCLQVPEAFHDYLDIFSRRKAITLPPW